MHAIGKTTYGRWNRKKGEREELMEKESEKAVDSSTVEFIGFLEVEFIECGLLGCANGYKIHVTLCF